MYRDDDVARSARANALIDEIAELERQKIAQSGVDQRLESARRELATLQVAPTAPPPAPRPGLLVHLGVFLGAAAAAYMGYGLLF